MVPKIISNIAEFRATVELLNDYCDGCSVVNELYSALSEVNFCSKYINRLIFRMRNETPSK